MSQHLVQAAKHMLQVWESVCGSQGWEPNHLGQVTKLREAIEVEEKRQPVAICVDAAAGKYECLKETPANTPLYL